MNWKIGGLLNKRIVAILIETFVSIYLIYNFDMRFRLLYNLII